MAELADASDLGSDGRPWGFKSLRLHQRNSRQKSGVSLCREGLFSLWLTRSALRATIAIPSLRSLQIPSTAPAQPPTKVGGFSLPRRAFLPVLTRKVFIRGVVGRADCGYKVIYIVRRYGMPDRNNTNRPQSNSFRRFCTAEPCQYVHYWLHSARATSSEMLLL